MGLERYLIVEAQHRPGIILTDTEIGLHRMGGNLAYQQYVRYLEKTSASVTAQETAGSVESFAEGYWDYLQAPLQVRMDDIVDQWPWLTVVGCAAAHGQSAKHDLRSF